LLFINRTQYFIISDITSIAQINYKISNKIDQRFHSNNDQQIPELYNKLFFLTEQTVKLSINFTGRELN